jgi:rRNA maturation endonuclease Nob1
MKNLKMFAPAFSQTDVIEVEDNSIAQYANQSRLVIKGIPILHTLNEIPLAGYGSCRACGCKGYISKHNGSHECKICGHHYDRHK